MEIIPALFTYAQTLGEFKPKDQAYGLNKLKGKTKKVYIASFSVNYQIYNEMQDFFVKKINKDGRAKRGGFLNNPAFLFTKLSKELDDAIIADVNLYVLFATPGGGFFKGPGASVKIKTSLRLADTEAIVMTDERKAIIKMKGQNETIGVSSAVNFYQGKVGMGAEVSYLGSLSKPLAIGGVVEDTKIKSAALGGVDILGTQTLYYTYYSPEDKSASKSQVIPVDAATYSNGVYEASKKFLEHHTQAFLKKL